MFNFLALLPSTVFTGKATEIYLMSTSRTRMPRKLKYAAIIQSSGRDTNVQVVGLKEAEHSFELIKGSEHKQSKIRGNTLSTYRHTEYS